MFSFSSFYLKFPRYILLSIYARYCTHLYLLELDLAQPREAETWVQGYLSLSLVGDKDSLLEHEISPE